MLTSAPGDPKCSECLCPEATFLQKHHEQVGFTSLLLGLTLGSELPAGRPEAQQPAGP